MKPPKGRRDFRLQWVCHYALLGSLFLCVSLTLHALLRGRVCTGASGTRPASPGRRDAKRRRSNADTAPVCPNPVLVFARQLFWAPHFVILGFPPHPPRCLCLVRSVRLRVHPCGLVGGGEGPVGGWLWSARRQVLLSSVHTHRFRWRCAALLIGQVFIQSPRGSSVSPAEA